jgi:hypothetical protein
MHSLGVVHGAVHARNIIIAADGSVKLTHVSPLLFNDPRIDLDALRALNEGLLGPCNASVETEASDSMRQWRIGTMVVATIIALAGIAAISATTRYVRQQRPSAHAPPVLRDSQ